MDSGLLLIVSAAELTQDDLGIITAALDPGRIETVWVGSSLAAGHHQGVLTVPNRTKDAVAAIVKASPKLGPNSPRCGKTKASSQKSPPNKDFRHVGDRSEKCENVIKGKNLGKPQSDSRRTAHRQTGLARHRL